MAADRVIGGAQRAGPDRFVPRRRTRACARASDHLVAYLGVMGPQDGVDYALRAVAHAARRASAATTCTASSWAPATHSTTWWRSARSSACRDIVEFTGRVPDEFVQRCLSTADVCLSPDPLNPLNDVSTMNKVVEYMAMGRPIVSFDLVEARVSAGDAAVYVPANDEAAFAEAIDELLNDPERRRRMGEIRARPGGAGTVLGDVAARARRFLLTTARCREHDHRRANQLLIVIDEQGFAQDERCRRGCAAWSERGRCADRHVKRVIRCDAPFGHICSVRNRQYQ